MIKIKDLITPQEWIDTKWALNQTKIQYGHNDYMTLKKMIVVAASKNNCDSYTRYKNFIDTVLLIMNTVNKSPINTFGFSKRKDEDGFYGIEMKTIRNSNPEELRAIALNKRFSFKNNMYENYL